MPMPLDEKKRGLIVGLISKKIKGSDSYDNLKSENESYKEVQSKDGAEQDYNDGLEQAADEMIQAMQSKDVKSFKSSLKSFVQMCMDEMESEEEED